MLLGRTKNISQRCVHKLSNASCFAKGGEARVLSIDVVEQYAAAYAPHVLLSFTGLPNIFRILFLQSC